MKIPINFILLKYVSRELLINRVHKIMELTVLINCRKVNCDSIVSRFYRLCRLSSVVWRSCLVEDNTKPTRLFCLWLRKLCEPTSSSALNTQQPTQNTTTFLSQTDYEVKKKGVAHTHTTYSFIHSLQSSLNKHIILNSICR
jgi:hypothetical protein